ncbi:MAG: MFS transporter, partial [SAR324 cluster bacterium]|nr:MFS transporter [SAR324 cluster bacterium]
VTGALAAVVYAVAAFAQLVVGRLIDRRAVKPILIFVAAGQPVFLGLMVLQQDYILFVVTLLAMGFVFGQIPITYAVLSRYVPDQWRTKVLSVKFMLNLLIGASALATARWMLSGGAGFEGVIQLLALAACLIVAAALVLPSRSSSSVLATAAS